MTTHSERGAFVDHLRLAHRHLHTAMRGVVAAFDEWVSANGERERGKALLERLILLRSELLNHFTEEDTGGCMEEAVSRCPSMSSDAKAVTAEHPLLERELDQLIARLGSALLSRQDVAAIDTDFRAFEKRLHAHESAENRILRYGFGAEAADADVDLDCGEE